MATGLLASVAGPQRRENCKNFFLLRRTHSAMNATVRQARALRSRAGVARGMQGEAE